MTHSGFSHRALIVFSFFIALIVHAGAIFLLQGHSVSSTFYRHAMIGHAMQPTQDATVEEEKEKTRKKKEELASVFQQLLSHPLELSGQQDSRLPEEETTEESFDIAKSMDELDSSDFEVQEHEVLAAPSFEEVDEILQIDTIGHEEVLQWQGAVTAPDFAVVFEGDDQVSTELIKATDAMLGEVRIDSLAAIEAEQGIRVGRQEKATLKGTALEQRSGFLHTGKQHSPVGGLPFDDEIFAVSKMDKDSLLASMEERVLVDTSRQEIKPIILRKESSLAEEIVTIDDMATIASSDDFTVDVEYQALKDREGYLFRLVLQPKEGVLFKRIRQNVFFLIDRSNSIPKKRYVAAKSAVAQALEVLNEGDTFNILIFDEKVVRFSSKNVPWNEENMHRAQRFLEQEGHGGLFASTDLYSSLDKIVPQAVADNEVNTAILLSDGDTFLNRDQQRRTIAEWTQKNSGKVSLHSVAAGKGNDLALLALMSSFNKGSLSYVSQDEEIEQALSSVMHTIRKPIGKDILVTVVSSSEGPHVTIYPQRSRLPDLYEGVPYVVMGVIDRLEDFHLFLQGRYYDKWLDIKQTVSFSKARVSQDHLEKEWNVHRAYAHYEEYLRDGLAEHLREARSLLKPLQIPVAFQ